jgi:hypothetical protein
MLDKAHRYNGPLGVLTISPTDRDHANAQRRGELSCGPDLISAVQEIRSVFPGAKVIRVASPRERKAEK